MDYFFVVLLCSILKTVSVHSEKDYEADYRKLPKLFHLDDYQECLERKDGVYCLGMFELHSDVHPNPIYDIIQEKSKDISHFNRSKLHRGYCLPSRCPARAANVSDSARFERCVDEKARARSLRARLHTLHYCQTHEQPRPITSASDTNDLPHQVFLYFVYFILVMAVIGTAYDLFAGTETKNEYLVAFSLRANWNQLTARDENVRPGGDMAIINYMRFQLGIGVMLWHIIILTAVYYQHNPSYIEKFLLSPAGYFIGAAMTFTITFILISNFLLSYNLLLLSKKQDVTLKNYPLFLIKRILRIYPMYLVSNGFASTWWKSFGHGPLWPLMVAKESDVCRRRFWDMTIFLQNIVDTSQICLISTWEIAVDIQLQIFTLFLTLWLVNRRQHAVKILTVVFVIATAFMTYKAFGNNLQPAYAYAHAEMVSTIAVDADSFISLYIHPITGIMAAVAGTMLGFLHLNHQERNVQISRSKFMVFLHHIAVLIGIFYCCLSYPVYRHFDRWMNNLMVPIERIFGALLCSFMIYSGIRLKGLLSYIGHWHYFEIMSRLSITVSLTHWFIAVLIVTRSPVLYYASGMSLVLDTIGLYVLSHIAAVPLTLLIDYPFQTIMKHLLKQPSQSVPPLKIKENGFHND